MRFYLVYYTVSSQRYNIGNHARYRLVGYYLASSGMLSREPTKEVSHEVRIHIDQEPHHSPNPTMGTALHARKRLSLSGVAIATVMAHHGHLTRSARCTGAPDYCRRGGWSVIWGWCRLLGRGVGCRSGRLRRIESALCSQGIAWAFTETCPTRN